MNDDGLIIGTKPKIKGDEGGRHSISLNSDPNAL
jgi:hypothetical protein